MMEFIAAAVFSAVILAVILGRERLRRYDRSTVFCPRAKTVVEIRDGVCQVKGSPRTVGVACACDRECLLPRGTDTRRGEQRELVGGS
jgi:hypothetical protein